MAASQSSSDWQEAPISVSPRKNQLPKALRREPAAGDAPSGDVAELLSLSKQLLESIDSQDWQTYAKLCHDSLTAFEPEARGQLVEGLQFHRFYFELNSSAKRSSSICSPQVRVMGDVALVNYSRLVQVSDSSGIRTNAFEETRVWQQIDGEWQHVHFHRSPPAT